MNQKPNSPQIGTFVYHKGHAYKIIDIDKNIFGSTLYSLYYPDSYNINALLDEISFWYPIPRDLCWFWNNDKDIPVFGIFMTNIDDYYVNHNKEKFLYCEPFLGRAPSFFSR